MSQISYYTQEGLDKLKEELYEMETVQRPSISQQIAEARDKGDLSENAEYDAAKEAQGLLEAKIAKLKEVISNARVIDDSDIDNSKVYILSTAKIKNVANGMELSYTLVAENEADLKAKKIIEIKINAEIKTLKSNNEPTASTSRNKVRFTGTVNK